MPEPPEGAIFVSLSKQEAPLYRWLCNHHDHDPGEHLQSRRLTLTPKHFAELTDMFANVGSTELRECQAGLAEDMDATVEADQMLEKLAKKLRENDMAEQAAAEIKASGMNHNPYA